MKNSEKFWKFQIFRKMWKIHKISENFRFSEKIWKKNRKISDFQKKIENQIFRKNLKISHFQKKNEKFRENLKISDFQKKIWKIQKKSENFKF